MKPTIGRIVHYVQEKPYQSSEPTVSRVMVTIPAIITAVWTDTCVNLQVFTDGTNSDESNMSPIKWITSANFDESDKPANRTWHWPAKV